MKDRRARLVYSTEGDGTCAGCGWPRKDCRCAATERRDGPVPAAVVARVRVETKGRGGKTVTVVDELPSNDAFLSQLARELKQACGTGGTVRDGAIELQGDRRQAVRELLTARGWRVRG
jgi:translation initiation factor 1